MVFGITFAALYGSAKDHIIKYDSHPNCSNTTKCNITFSLNEELPSPVNLYYILGKFEQNYETYFKSFSGEQLSGKYLNKEQLGACGNAVTNGYMGYKKDFSGKADLLANDTATPCGYIAYSMFNGKYIFI